MNSKRLYITLFIISIIFLSLGGTFAYLTASAVATNITQIKSGNLTMTVDGGGSTNVSLMPAKCTSSYAIKKKIVASATNTSGGKVSFSIGMNIATLGEDFKRNTMRYVLTTNSSSCMQDIVAGGSFKGKTQGSDIWLIKNDYDNITRTGNTFSKTYYLYIWLDEMETQNLSGSISVKMKGTSSNNPNLKTVAGLTADSGTLYYKIESIANKTTTIDFSKTSEQDNNNGVYMTTNTDSGIPVYYYRGNVDNRVIFANKCWRIIRTTETGGVKLIYDGVPSNGQCNNTGGNSAIAKSAFNSSRDNAKYVGYMYGSSIDDTANTTDSTIKTSIDTWYKNNMTNYTDKLEDTVFCSDRSYTTNGSTLNFVAKTRLGVNKTPTLKCENLKDRFTVDINNGNGNLTYPVALITADETAYAGAVLHSTNSTFYLKIGTWFVTMTPYDFTSSAPNVFYNGGSGHFNGADGGVYDASGSVRPVVSLKPGIAMTGGSGTATDPFIVG